MKKSSSKSIESSRITRQKKWIFESLEKSPLSVNEIYFKLVKRGCHVDKATIYRNLNELLKKGVIFSTRLLGKESVYELVDKSDHHHHIVCIKCKKIRNIYINENDISKDVFSQSRFKNIEHRIEFFGICPICN